DWDVTDEQIDEQLQSLRERYAEVDEVDRAAADGDLVTVNLDVTVDGEKLESAHVEDALYEIGSGGVTPKLDEELIGKSAGDEFTYDDNLPDDYPEHGGKPATFAVTVVDVREKTLPDLDDDFAASASGFDTIAELRDDLRTSLRRRNVTNAQHELRGKILDAYLARVDIELPPAMIQGEVDERLHQLEHQAEQYGMSADDLLSMQASDRETFTDDARTQATSSVKARLVLDRLAETLDVKIETSDIEQEILRHAQQSNMAPNEVAKVVQEQGSLPVLVGDIMRRRAIDQIVEAADIEGEPDEATLIELGLAEDPDAEPAEESSKDAPGLIVPGQKPSEESESELIVPGRD
ncbi:MAG: trigger factor, partial [Nitriliruptoraceae bacterium]